MENIDILHKTYRFANAYEQFTDKKLIFEFSMIVWRHIYLGGFNLLEKFKKRSGYIPEHVDQCIFSVENRIITGQKKWFQ